MSSEAEFERLYQEWIRNGGGAVTLAETNTPAEYYDGVSSTDLTPEQLAELQARQSHYNRTQALQVFSSEISANNFTNPYDARSTASINAFTNFATSPGVLAMAALSSAFSSAFSDAGLSSTETSLLLAGLSSALGVDFSNMLLVAGLSGAAIPMYSSLQNHTNSQITNLPQTLEQASSLADMNQQFGEQADSCSLFNELMGLMSGAFDGIMDFMDAGLDKVKELLGPVIGAISDITAGITGAISDITAGITGAITDGISSIVGAISDMIPQSIKDVFNEIGNIANSMMNGIAALANQITSEIANLKSMADSIAAKLAALALAAATLDPCKLAVLLNTGSPELKSAAQNMISPVTNVVSNIATELDPRANADEVNTIVEEAKNAAATAAGVPQSPMTLAAKLYSPFDSYLHDIEPDFSSIFNTDEKFTSTETQSGNSIVTKLPETGSSPSSRLDSKGATPSSRLDSKGATPSSRLDSKGATPKSDNEIPTPTSTREFESEVFATWKKNYLTDFLKIRSDAAMIRSEIERVLDTAHFPNTALKGESKNLVDNARKIIRRTKAHMNAVKVSLSYTSNTGSRDPDKEITARDTYIDRYLNGSHTRREKFKRELDTIQRSWNSIRSQVIYNGPR